MKEILKYLLRFIINIFSFFYNYECAREAKKYRNVFYSYWLKNSIAKCGKGFHVQSPAYFDGGKYMTIGDRFGSLERLRIEIRDEFAGTKFTPQLIIGDDVKMNYNNHIGCINSVKIGNNVLFASNVFITDHQHGFIDERDINVIPTNRSLFSRGPVVIEDNVWIGENVVIMPDVTIGKGSIIGANSVVTKSFPEYSVLAGMPARLLKSLKIDQKDNEK